MKLLNNAVIRLTKNRKPAYDPENELMWDRTYNSSSGFVIGHFEAEGHKLNYLYHQMPKIFSCTKCAELSNAAVGPSVALPPIGATESHRGLPAFLPSGVGPTFLPSFP